MSRRDDRDLFGAVVGSLLVLTVLLTVLIILTGEAEAGEDPTERTARILAERAQRLAEQPAPWRDEIRRAPALDRLAEPTRVPLRSHRLSGSLRSPVWTSRVGKALENHTIIVRRPHAPTVTCTVVEGNVFCR